MHFRPFGRTGLSFSEVGFGAWGTKSAAQAELNFGQVPGGVLAAPVLARIAQLQAGLPGPT